MEISDITNVAKRKRMNADVEQLRDQIKKETAKIIKLKVAQDTAYWDLKEKLRQVESNHERLQQNMVEVQMQHETISGQYQEELRLRPETLNKLVGTREICSVLEGYGTRLKETLSRCRADQDALCEAYERAADALRGLRQKAARGEEAAKAMEHQVKLASEHQNQLLQVFSASKQQMDTEISELKSKLEDVTTTKDKLVSSVNEMSKKLDISIFEIGKKEETITNLQLEMKQLNQKFNTQCTEAKKTLEKKKKDLMESIEANTSLKNTLQSQELFIKSICDQNKGLQQRMVVLEEEQVSSTTKIVDMKRQLEDAAVMHEKSQSDLRVLQEEKVLLTNEVEKKGKLLSTYESEIENLKSQMTTLVADNSTIKIDFEKSTEESKTKTEQIEKLSLDICTYIKKLEDTENSLIAVRNASDDKIKGLTLTLESQNKDLDSKASTITQLMSELKTSTDIRSKLESTLQRVKKENDLEKEKFIEKERQQSRKIEQLEGVVRDKEVELSKQMSIILEMRDEKERLQEKIQGMQNTIDNIQKELTGRPAAVKFREQPEHDDNAVMMTPGEKTNQIPNSPIIQKKSEFLTPRKEPKLDSMLYNLFSDSSMDGDTVDASEVNRRFAAMSRGEHPPPAPLATLKRRAKTDNTKERNFFKNKTYNKIKKMK